MINKDQDVESLLSDGKESFFYTIPVDNEQRALEWSAVLESQKIGYEIQKNPDNDDCFFLIQKDDFSSAVENIDAYESERPFFERLQELFTASPAPLRLKITLPCFLFSLFLTIFYFLTGPASSKSVWQQKGMLSSKFFSESQWWSPVTSLTLHSDFPHLAGNMIFFIIFGTAAAIQAGAGTVLFFVLLSGVLGNLTTLMFFGERIYNAIGFSTSVFAVLGILSTLRLMQNIKIKKISSFYFWLPLLAAIAIFGLTGGAAGSDLAGHLFGFIWGGITGVAVHYLVKWKKNLLFQSSMAIITLSIIGFSWYCALQ